MISQGCDTGSSIVGLKKTSAQSRAVVAKNLSPTQKREIDTERVSERERGRERERKRERGREEVCV